MLSWELRWWWCWLQPSPIRCVDPELWVHFWLNNKLLSTIKKDKHLNIQTFQPASIVLVEHHASANWPISHLKNWGRQITVLQFTSLKNPIIILYWIIQLRFQMMKHSQMSLQIGLYHFHFDDDWLIDQKLNNSFRWPVDDLNATERVW